MKTNWKQLAFRKITAASISACLFAIAFACFMINPFHLHFESIGDYIGSVKQSAPLFLLYAYPVMVTYGAATSYICELIVGELARNGLLERSVSKTIVSAALHTLFGLVLLYISLLAAWLFFMTDLALARRKKPFGLKEAALAALLPIGMMAAYWFPFR